MPDHAEVANRQVVLSNDMADFYQCLPSGCDLCHRK
jgi:hypothetical protein